MCRLYGNIAPFYIEDLSICGFWYLREGKFLEPILHKYRGRIHIPLSGLLDWCLDLNESESVSCSVMSNSL